MKSRCLVALFVVAGLVAPIATLAADPAGYVAIKLGAYQPSSKRLGISDADAPSALDFKTGFNGELACGYKFMPFMAGELGVGYFQTKATYLEALNAPIDNTLRSTKIKVDVIPVLLSAKGIFPIGTAGELYALAGVGITHTKIKAEDVNKSKTAFAWQVGIGGDYNLAQNLFLGAELKYLGSVGFQNLSPPLT